MLCLKSLESKRTKKNDLLVVRWRRKRAYSTRITSIFQTTAAETVEWEEGSCESNGLTLMYHHTKQDPTLPLVIYLHGLTSCGPAMMPLFSQLAPLYRILLPTARGHGTSGQIPVGSFTMDNLVLDALATINHFSPDDSFFLVGHSMGAAIAARIAKIIPERVLGVVLEEPPWLRLEGEPILPSPTTPNPFANARKFRQLSDLEFEKLKINMFTNFSSFQSFKLAVRQMESERLFDADGIEPTFRATDDDINEAVSGITVPTLLQTAGGPNAVCSPEIAERIMKTWASGKLNHFPTANHVIHDPPHTTEWLLSVDNFFKSVLSKKA